MKILKKNNGTAPVNKKMVELRHRGFRHVRIKPI
jgi:hypothetical protein